MIAGYSPIYNPSFLDADEVGNRMRADEYVIGVSINGDSRAYSVVHLYWKEVVRDTVGGTPIVVTWCPNCLTTIVYDRTVDGEVYNFGVSGRLMRRGAPDATGCLVMFDHQTKSLWSQVLGAGVSGEHAGRKLRPVPHTLTTWEEWVKLHPDSKILDEPPSSGDIDIVVREPDDSSFQSRWDSQYAAVSVAQIGDRRIGYLFSRLADSGVQNTEFNGVNVLLFYDSGSKTALIFDRTVDGQTLSFRHASGSGADTVLVDRQTGSKWQAFTGVATEGELKGKQLRRIHSHLIYWKIWKNHYPGAQLYPTPVIPAQPTNLAVGATAGELDLSASWDAVEGATLYDLRWRQADREFEADNATTVADTNATFTMPESGQWEVRVQGCNDVGCGPEAAQAVTLLAPPGAVQNLEVSATPGQLNLPATWEAVDGATSYKLRWRQSGGEFKADNSATVTDAMQFITVSDYGQWEVRVQGCNDAGCGPEASGTVDVVQQLRSSLEPAQDAGGDDRPRSITANWDPVPGAASYTLQWQRIGVNLPEQEQAQRNGALRQARSASGGIAQKVNAQPENRITVPADQTSAEFNVPDGGAYEVELQARAAGNELIARSNHHVNQAPDQPDTTPPRLVRGQMDGDRMFLYFSEPLNESIVGGLLLTYVQYDNCYCSTGGWYGAAMEVSGNKVITDFKGSIRAVEGLSASVSYWVRPGDTSLRDLAGNKVWTPNVHYGGSRSTGNISLHNITGRPFVTDVEISSDEGDDRFYASGETIRMTLTFSEEVNVTGTPRLKIDLDPADGGEKWADYSGGSGTVELAFGYTVVEGDISTDGVAVLRNTLELNSGAIRSATAITVEDARLGHKGLDHNSTHKVVTPNTAAPLLVSASVTGTTLTLTFSEALGAAASLANSAFTVKKTPQGASEQTVSLSGSPVIDGATVTLTLASTVIATDTGVKVSYAKPASGSNNKLVDTGGTEVASFTDRIVTSTADTTPPRLVRAQVNSNVITLFFSEPLDEYSGGEGDYLRVSMRVAEYGGRSTTFTIKSEVVEGDTTVKGDVRIAGNKVTVGLPLRTLSGYGLYTIYYVRPLDPVGDRFRDLAGNAVWAPHDRGQYDAYTRKPLRSTGSIELVNVTAPPD